jgi:thymidylate synthase
MINIKNEYKGLLSEILDTGMDKSDRTGTGTKSVFGRTIRHDMSLGFPILTAKKISFNAARTELLWILQGRTDLKYLEDNGVKYWRPDYERSGRTDETLGPVYGKQWRDFNGVDQLKNLVYSINTDAHSRRLVVSAWAPHELDEMALPPCHYAFQVYINNGVMDLMWHLYNNHLDQAKEFRRRHNPKLPQLELDSGIFLSISNDLYIPESNKIKLINYNPLSAIKAELSVGK